MSSKPADHTVGNPTDVATDPPRTVAPSTKGADIFITYADWDTQLRAITVGGYLDGIVEDDGTCTLTLTKGGTAVKTSQPGTSDMASTDCAGLSIPRSKLAPGTWTAVVTYRSRTSSGSSAPKEVRVP
jgi:hypothetical protein